MQILDGMSPYVWQGPTASDDWYGDVLTEGEHVGGSGYQITLGEPRHVDVTGDNAYVVVPAREQAVASVRRERAVAVQQVPTMAAARREQAFGAAQHDLEVGHRQERRSDSLDEIDLILPSPPLQDLPVGCLRNVLDGKMPPAMITHRVDRHPVTLVKLGIVVFEGAHDEGVARTRGQQIVDLLADLVPPANPAPGFKVESIVAEVVLFRGGGGPFGPTAVMASPRPTSCAPRNPAMSPCRGSDPDSRGRRCGWRGGSRGLFR